MLSKLSWCLRRTPLLLLGSGAAILAATPAPLLRTVAEVAKIERLPGMPEHPVTLEGAVLYSDPQWGLLFLADSTGSIFIQARRQGPAVAPGTRVRVHGFTAPGHTKSIVTERRMEVLGRGALPSATPLGLDQVDRGAADSSLVEVRGVLRPWRAEPGRTAFRIFEGKWWAAVVLPVPMKPEAVRMIGRTVTVRGVSGLLIGREGERIAPQIFANTVGDIRVDSSGDETVEATPRPIASLADLAVRRFRHAIRVRGIVKWLRGRNYFLEDPSGAIFVEQPAGDLPKAGQMATVTGFPDDGAYGLTLADASAELAGMADVPSGPVNSTAKEIAESSPRGRLVHVTGQFVEQTTGKRDHTFIIEDRGVRFSAQILERGFQRETIRLAHGAWIGVTGVATAGLAMPGAPRFVVRVLSPADIVTLQAGMSHTLRNMAPVLAAIAFAGAICLCWIIQLRRTVRRQTEVLRKAMDQAVELAGRDELTGLPNRRRFAEALEAMGGQPATLLYVDLDGFKLVNDSLGHTVGDTLLREVAARLSRNAGSEPVVARLGGDEFCLLIRRVLSPSEASALAQGLLAAIAEPANVDGHEIVIGASIGISSAAAGDHAAAADLLQRADNAMYSAKRQGRNRFEFFSDELGYLLRERTNLELQLRGAIGRGEISVCYQPEFDIDTNRLVRFEALLRWDHPTLGAVPPSRFIPVAEESGLIVALGAFVMQQACLEARDWPGIGGPIQVAINVSSVQFRREGFADEVAAVLRATGIRPERVQLELTESVALGGTMRCATVMNRLKDLGVSLAIDDFGTGYSSLSYLHSLPFDALKLDRGFVMGIDATPEREALVGSIIALASNVGLRVIVEGVETPGELEVIRRAGGREVQGFLLGKPSKAPRELIARYHADAGDKPPAASSSTSLRNLAEAAGIPENSPAGTIA